MKWPPLPTPELSPNLRNFLLCVAHYLATQSTSKQEEVVGCHPPSVRLWALQRHFSPAMLQLSIIALAKLDLMKRNESVEGAVYLTERGVLYLQRAGLVPIEFRHNFGDFDAPDVGDDDLEQLDDEDDDDFADRCSAAHMDALKEIDDEFDLWGATVWQTPDFMGAALQAIERGDGQ